MIQGFDRIVIGVPDLDVAIAEYTVLLGARPLSPGDRQRAWLALSNTVIELVETPGDSASIDALVLTRDDPGEREEALPNSLNLDLRLGDGRHTRDFRANYAPACLDDIGVDHLVLRAVDAERCIDLFNKELGIRLALDQEVPEWGGRMLFFRAGKLTLEVIANLNAGDVDAFWGLTFHCPDIAAHAAGLRAAGVELSEVRDGRKPGTRVATVHSHCLGLPTLLLQPAPR